MRPSSGGSAPSSRKPSTSVEPQHLADVRRAELEDARHPRVRARSTSIRWRHRLEERARRLGAHVPEAAARKAWNVSGIPELDGRVRVLLEVPLRLVEELARERDVRRVDEVDLADVRDVRNAVGRAGRDRARDDPLEAARRGRRGARRHRAAPRDERRARLRARASARRRLGDLERDRAAGPAPLLAHDARRGADAPRPARRTRRSSARRSRARPRPPGGSR